MSKITVDLKKVEGSIEGDAQKLAEWLAKTELKISGTLKDIPDLVAFIESVEQALATVGSDAANPLQLVLNPSMPTSSSSVAVIARILSTDSFDRS